MLTIYVVDMTAESRNRIIAQINDFLNAELADTFLIPRINLKPVAPAELKFNAAPDICIIGEELASTDLGEIAALRKLLPESGLIVRTAPVLENIATFEQLARLGVEDTFSEGITALEFFRKIILLAKRKAAAKGGQLIVVESGKGGLGVTSITAAIGEVLFEEGHKVLLVDLDTETQDLSRFLQAKPYINENLQLLIDGQRLVSEESVMQCVVPAWEDEDGLCCMSPVADLESSDARGIQSRMLLSIFDMLDRAFDFIVVDAGGARGSVQRTLYRVADKIICLVNNDPTSLYGAAQKISAVRSHMSVNARLVVMESAPFKHALPANLVRSEVSRAAKINPADWLPEVVPFCISGGRWAGSGSTLYSLGGRHLRRCLRKNLGGLGLVKESEEKRLFPLNLRRKKAENESAAAQEGTRSLISTGKLTPPLITHEKKDGPEGSEKKADLLEEPLISELQIN